MNLTILYLTKEDSTKLKKRCEKGKSSDFPFLCLSVPERATCEHKNTATHEMFACDRLNVPERATCEHIKDDLTRNVRMDRLKVPERATCEHIKDDRTRNVRMDRLKVHEGIRTSDPTLRSEF